MTLNQLMQNKVLTNKIKIGITNYIRLMNEGKHNEAGQLFQAIRIVENLKNK